MRCLDLDTVLGAIDLGMTEEIEVHIDRCTWCRRLLSAAVRERGHSSRSPTSDDEP